MMPTSVWRQASHVRIKMMVEDYFSSKPVFGDTSLDAIRPPKIQSWVVELLEVKKLAPSTVVGIYNTFGSILKTCVRVISFVHLLWVLSCPRQTRPARCSFFSLNPSPSWPRR